MFWEEIVKIKDYIIKNIYNIFLIIVILVLFFMNLFEFLSQII